MPKTVRSIRAPRPRGPYSPAVIAGDLVFVAGQIPVNPDTNELELGDTRAQTRRTLENLRLVLEGAGCSMRDVVRVGVYLADLGDFAAMNEVYEKFFPANPPSRTTVGAQLPKIKIEIDCVAHIPSK